MNFMLAQLLGPFGIFITIFWLWMIYDCVQNESERQTWLWLLIFLNGAGALVYFVARYLPRLRIPIPNVFGRWTRRDELWQAEAAARNIGNAHQYANLGEILLEIGQPEKAADAFQKALEKEGDNLKALWGVANIALQQKNYLVAREHFQKLLLLDPNHRFGDASFSYGKVLFELAESDKAAQHFKEHLKSWGHPEAYLMLAKLQEQGGKNKDARESLETMIARLKGSPPYHFRQNRHFVCQAQKALKTLASS